MEDDGDNGDDDIYMLWWSVSPSRKWALPIRPSWAPAGQLWPGGDDDDNHNDDDDDDDGDGDGDGDENLVKSKKQLLSIIMLQWGIMLQLPSSIPVNINIIL